MIRRISNTNTYIDIYSGESYTSRDIDRETKKAKGVLVNVQLLEFGYNFCEDENHAENIKGKEDWIEAKWIDCSHEISVKKCKETGEIEAIFDINNMKLRCRICHKIHDKIY